MSIYKCQWVAICSTTNVRYVQQLISTDEAAEYTWNLRFHDERNNVAWWSDRHPVRGEALATACLGLHW